MTLSNRNLTYISQVFFADGWFFFVPYLFFYLCFKFIQLPVGYLQGIFVGLHLFNFLLLFCYLRNSLTKIKLQQLAFWFVIILLFLIPGAYLEFPSDAWDHFRRIFSWQASNFVSENALNYKFTYFWGWTFMSGVQPLYRRTALDIYSAFWQFLLAYQFYLFALRLGFSESWAKVQALGTICLFGTNVFGFYRYYALSSTPLAYIAYLRSLIVILDSLEGKRKQVFFLLLLVPIIYNNHFQELLLLVISSTLIVALHIYQKQKINVKNKLIIGFWLIYLTLFTFGTLLVSNFKRYQYLINYFWLKYFNIYFGQEYGSDWNLDQNYWTSWGILRIWDKNLPYLQTLGIYGCLSLLFSLIFWKKYRLLATLTIAPVLLLLLQPFTLTLTAISAEYTTFRILYTFPYSFMLVVGLKKIADFFTKRINYSVFSINNYWLIGLVVVLLSLQPNLPSGGRLWFQLYKPPAQLSLRNLDVTAQWFFENRQLDSKCLIHSDSATGFMLATHFALQPTVRLSPYNPSQHLITVERLKSYLNSQEKNKLCGFLVGVPRKINPPPTSKIAQLSGHWHPNLVKKDFDYSPEFLETATFLNSLGWTQSFVPPFYWFYEAPSNKKND